MEIKEYNEQQPVSVAKQSDERRDVAQKVIARFYDMREQRQKSNPFFRNRTLLQYIEDSVKRINQYKEKPSWKKWWQSNLSSGTPRNKLIGILSKLAGQAMVPKVVAENDTSIIAKHRERVANYLLKKANYKNQDDAQLILEMYEAMVKGTVIGYEGWKYDNRNVRIITNEDPETGKINFKEQKIKFWNDVWGEIVPLEDIYFGDIYVKNIQDMPDLIWRTVLKKDQFDAEFGKYTDTDLVQSKQVILTQNEDKTIFYQPSDDIEDNEVEILRYFNQYTDEFLIIANGIWINPIKKDDISPIPFNHKRLPFWLAKFEILDAKFIYGKSLADKMIADSDTEDKVWDNILDRLSMALKAPLIAQGTNTSLTDGYLEPDKVIMLEEGNPNAKVERLNLQEPGAASFRVLEIINGRLNQTSVDPETIGSSGAGNKTARQVLIEREGALQLVSLFLKLMEFGIRDKYYLRLANIFQFYTMSNHKTDKDEKFRKITLKNEKMNNGKLGTVEIEFVDKVNAQQLKTEGMLNPDVEKIQIENKFINDFEAEIVMVQRSSVEKSEELEQAKEFEFQKMILGLYPDMVDKEVLFQDLINKFRDKDISKLKKSVSSEQQPEMANMSAGGAMGMPEMGMPGQNALENYNQLDKQASLKDLI